MLSSVTELLPTLPQRFLPHKAVGVEAVFYFDLSETPFTVRINQGVCKVTKEKPNNPICTITATDAHYLQLETGELSPQWALMSGKVKVSNLAEMMRFSQWFRKFKPEFLHPTPEKTPLLSRPPKQGILAGVRILDLSRLLPAPLATQYLSDMGAEVIKIESAESPDATRTYPPFINGQSVYYLALNRGKRSLTLDLYAEKDKSIFKKLIQTADVVIESFRPGVMQKIGIDYETMKELNPKIIYVSVTGYGQTGPYASKAGHDLNFVGYGGLLGLTGSRPTLSAAQIADVAGGSYLTISAVLAALFQREKIGKGEHVDVSMSDAVLPLLSLTFAEKLNTQKYAPAGKGMLYGGMANYNVYETQDGKFMALAALEPHFFQQFCEAVARPEWMQFALPTPDAQHTLHQLLTAFFLTRTQADWIAFAQNLDVCLTPVYDLEQICADPHFQHRQIFQTHTHPVYGSYQSVAFPLKFTQNPLHPTWASPILGEDTASILEEMGEG